MIKVFKIDGMRDTPFASEAALNVLREQNVLATDKLKDSDITQ